MKVITTDKIALRKNSNMLIIHNGKFHAHDVCAAVLFNRHFNGDVTIVRTRDAGLIKSLYSKGAYVCDVGGEQLDGWLDHHQQGFEYKSIKQMFFFTEDCNDAEKCILNHVSLIDNGLNGTDYLTSAVTLFNPTWAEALDIDKAFAEAMYFVDRQLSNAQPLINLKQRELLHNLAKQDATRTVLSLCKGKQVLELPCWLPWIDAVKEYNQTAEIKVKFTIWQDQDMVRCQVVPDQDIKIVATEGVDGCIFIHRNKFIAGFVDELSAFHAVTKSL